MLLPDITQYYTNDSDHFSEDQYKRKRNETEETVIGKCHFLLCELPIYSDSEVYVDGNEVYCCRMCMDEQKLWEDENE